MRQGWTSGLSETKLLLFFVLLPDDIEVSVFPITFPQLHGSITDVLAVQLPHRADEVLRILEGNEAKTP